jgi:hypothetical protein
LYNSGCSFLENGNNTPVRNKFRECETSLDSTRSQYSSSGRKNGQRIFHVGQSSKSSSESNVAQQSGGKQKPGGKQKLNSLPIIPQIAADWLNLPYVSPGASHIGNTYPRDCRSLEIVPGWNEGGCGVTCVSMITGLSYKECRDKALAVGGFTPDGGMLMDGIAQTFRALGVNARLKYFESWRELPDLAVLGVWITTVGHAVVFKRKNGKGYIFDRNAEVPLSPERFTLMDNTCVAIPNRHAEVYPEQINPRIVLPSQSANETRSAPGKIK